MNNPPDNSPLNSPRPTGIQQSPEGSGLGLRTVMNPTNQFTPLSWCRRKAGDSCAKPILSQPMPAAVSFPAL